MKKVILLALAFTATLCANAQRLIDGSLKNLTQIKAIQVVFEYKNAVVQGLPYAEFMEKEQREFSNRNYKDFKDEWNRSLAPELLYRFIEGYNKIANRKNLPVFTSKKADYKLTVDYNRLDRNGQASAEYIFTDKGGRKIAVVQWDSPKGGTFGTFKNLIGDAGEKNGKDFAKFLSAKKVKRESNDDVFNRE